MKNLKVFLVLMGFVVLASSCTDRPHLKCAKSHEETYYDSTGTSLYLMRGSKSPMYLGLNGNKTRTVCDEWIEVK